jgi:hypothetical protein
MRKLLPILVLAMLLPVGPMVRPTAHAQQSSITLTMAVTLVQHVDVFQSASQTYTLTQAPAPSTRPQVFVNGILMCDVCGQDYSLAGTTLRFTGQQTAQMASPTIQVWYWAMN